MGLFNLKQFREHIFHSLKKKIQPLSSSHVHGHVEMVSVCICAR